MRLAVAPVFIACEVVATRRGLRGCLGYALLVSLPFEVQTLAWPFSLTNETGSEFDRERVLRRDAFAAGGASLDGAMGQSRPRLLRWSHSKIFGRSAIAMSGVAGRIVTFRCKGSTSVPIYRPHVTSVSPTYPSQCLHIRNRMHTTCTNLALFLSSIHLLWMFELLVMDQRSLRSIRLSREREREREKARES